MENSPSQPTDSCIKLTQPDVFFITWGGCGLLRPASGTWGSLGAIPFALGLHYMWGWPALLIGAVALYLAAMPVINFYEKRTGRHDDDHIVIDEVIGMFICLIPAAMNVIDIVTAFLLFRLFDALKPGIIGRVDRTLGGAHGVLLDDVIAGLIAACGMVVLHVLVS
jgi:phosphatidylglycerophosphatase A